MCRKNVSVKANVINDSYVSFFFRSHSVCQITVERTRSKGGIKPAAEGKRAINSY